MESETTTKGSSKVNDKKAASKKNDKNVRVSPGKSKDSGKKAAPVKDSGKKASGGKKKPVPKKGEKKGSSESSSNSTVIPKATVKKMVLKNVKDDKMRIAKEIYDEVNKVVDQLMAKHWSVIQKELESSDKKTVKEEVLLAFPSFDGKYHLKDAKLDEKNFTIAKAVFQRKTRALSDVSKEKKYLFSHNFLVYYQAFVEAEIATLLDEVIGATSHAKRVTIKTQDVEMVQKILNKN